MPKFEKAAKNIVETLALKWTPIAGKFSDCLDEKGNRERKLKICEAFDVVRRENIMISFSKDNCACAGGSHFVGFESLPLDTLAGILASKEHKIYESASVAKASIGKQPQPVNRGKFFFVGPLEKFETDPDLVFLFVNPAQADRILGLAAFNGAEPFTYYPASSICSIITNTFANRRPEINLISAFERRNGKWSSDELMIALPLHDFKVAVENIPKSGYGTLK